uniref:ABC transporter permease n=1 Tax=Clostridium sp. TaxID=1506 RepID=UPI002608525A
MNNSFYAKLAITNIKKNGKTYFPYILTCIGTIIMFYIMHFISVNKGLNSMSGGNLLKTLLNLGTYVIGFFSIIFLFYTNSFLIKRRKKELGLYNILGMEKKHIAKVLFLETFFVAIISIIVGLTLGILLSKLMFLVLLKLLNFKVQMGFFISIQSIAITAILFGIIFVLTLINNLRQIHLARPIELLKGSESGEKEPKTKWILTLFGVLCLVSGYYIALTTESPLGALNKFFLAVILVIIGTYALFTVGSIALLKILRKNKKFYYKTNNFINVSGMIYRMKQNAVGLANICILSTAVLVMLSTTVSLYIGMDNLLRTRYPRNISVSAKNVSNETSQILDNMITEEAKKLDISINNIVRYRSMPLIMTQDKNSFSVTSSESFSSTNISMVNLISLSEYNRIQNQSATLNENEILLFSFRGKVVNDSISISGNEFKIKERINTLNTDGMDSAMLVNTYYIIVPDEETIQKVCLSSSESNDDTKDLSYYYAFDTDSDAESEINLTFAIQDKLQENSVNGFAESLEESRESFFSLYGGLFFLGIFLGTLFIMATVLIIYYKQISEGYDDKNRFEIMQKVGMSKAEVKKSIGSQVLMVFFLPLVTAVIHIAFAFKVITKLLALLNLTNITLFAICT